MELPPHICKPFRFVTSRYPSVDRNQPREVRWASRRCLRDDEPAGEARFRQDLGGGGTRRRHELCAPRLPRIWLCPGPEGMLQWSFRPIFGKVSRFVTSRYPIAFEIRREGGFSASVCSLRPEATRSGWRFR